MAMLSAQRLAASRLRSTLQLTWPRTRGRKRYRPTVELLEDRCLLATWSSIGPAPQQQTGGAVTGRVYALAIAPTQNQGSPTLFLGAATGGVWSSTDFT